jgi:hypothetical protein
MGKKAVTRILMGVFLLGILVELFYVVPVIMGENEPQLVYERSLTAGITIAILIILVVVLNRQRRLTDRIKYLESQRPPRTEEDIRKEIAEMRRDINALQLVFEDGLIEKKEFRHKKKFLEKEIRNRERELHEMKENEKKAKKPKETKKGSGPPKQAPRKGESPEKAESGVKPQIKEAPAPERGESYRPGEKGV